MVDTPSAIFISFNIVVLVGTSLIQMQHMEIVEIVLMNLIYDEFYFASSAITKLTTHTATHYFSLKLYSARVSVYRSR